MSICPCGTGNAYDTCCGPYIVGEKLPDTPEQLMRSRYTAFTQANMDYIANTMANEALADFDKTATADWAKSLNWQKLDIVKTHTEGDKGFVEFIAHFAYHQDDQYLHELSEFHKINGKWVYVDGVEPPKNETVVKDIKLGRNEPCHCGSGKKFKKCCMAA